jgi:Domain of unknown function (DU1801)
MAKPNKTQITQITALDFIGDIETSARREEAHALVALFEKHTSQAAKMWGPSIIGFGVSHYTYESGRAGTAPIIAFSPRKAQLVFYGLGGSTLSPELGARLGKHSTGKGCLYVKKLSNVDVSVLAELAAVAWAGHNNNNETIVVEP